MPLRNQDAHPSRDPANEAGEVSRAKELQSQLSGGGFAGLTFPTEYGGQGLGIRYEQIFDEESAAYEMPTILRVPTLAIIGPTLEACGTLSKRSGICHRSSEGTSGGFSCSPNRREARIWLG
jgi:alkylation response protein AidB-like acyl-CoA dehydrogenase